MFDQLTIHDVSATGTVVSGRRKLYSVILDPAAAVATLVLRDGGAGGTVKMRLQAGASGSDSIWTSQYPILFETDIHATITGAGAAADLGSTPA